MFRTTLFSIFLTLNTFLVQAGEPTGDPEVVLKTPRLIAFWTYGEDAGEAKNSIKAGDKFALTEVAGPIERADVGPYSGYSMHLNGKQYLKLPYKELGKLNISGKDAQVSMFAVVRIVNLQKSRTIAGIWSEGKGKDDDTGTRQYALLMNMPTYGGLNQLTPHISAEGGVTRRADGSSFPWCADYAASREVVPTNEWCTLGFTYDSQYITAYVNGAYEPRSMDAVKDKRNDPYFTKEGPGGKDRGVNPYYHGKGIFSYEPEKHRDTKPMGGADFTVGARYAVGSFTGEATIGHFGGLAVFDRALSKEEMHRLHESANVKVLNELKMK